MFANWQSPRPRVVPLAGSIFSVFPTGPALGQQDTASYMARAQVAVTKYDALLGRVANIGNEAARNEMLTWISRSDVPGTPAERRNVVAQDLANSGVGTTLDTLAKRISGLEEINNTFEAKVKVNEQAYPSVQNPKESGQVKVEGVFTKTGIVLGVVSVLGLLVVPLMVSGDK